MIKIIKVIKIIVKIVKIVKIIKTIILLLYAVINVGFENSRIIWPNFLSVCCAPINNRLLKNVWQTRNSFLWQLNFQLTL